MFRLLRTSLFMSALLLCAPAQADVMDEMKHASDCTQDQECIVTQGVCGEWLSVNSGKKSDYNAILDQLRPIVSCPQFQQLPQPSGSQCVNNSCTVKP